MDLNDLLKPLCRYLNDSELFHVFTGELALRMLGLPTEVKGLEVLANLTDGERDRLLNFLEHESWGLTSRWKGPLGLRHGASGAELLVRQASSTLELNTIARRSTATLGFLTFFIPSAEDLILSALEGRGPALPAASALFRKWRDFLDLEYLITTSRSSGTYGKFIRLKMRSER